MRRSKVNKINAYRYSMVRSAIMTLMGEYGCTHVSVEETSPAFETKKVFGVHWSAPGTQSVQDANLWLRAVTKAAQIAEMLNLMELEVDFDKQEKVITADNWTEQFALVKGLLKDESQGLLGRWIAEGNF